MIVKVRLPWSPLALYKQKFSIPNQLKDLGGWAL
jgi:hypothetical protein